LLKQYHLGKVKSKHKIQLTMDKLDLLFGSKGNKDA
jgi:hypothetical protein